MRAQSCSIAEYIQSLKNYEKLASDIVFHKTLSGKEPEYEEVERPWPAAVQTLLATLGIRNLYSHQARAINLIRKGHHTVAATPTASGKTLIYNLPVLEKILENPQSRALYLFPLKALAQDQLKTLQKLLAQTRLNKNPQPANSRIGFHVDHPSNGQNVSGQMRFDWPENTLASFAPTAAIYDGDTSARHKAKIRQNPPNILLTNPDMLHLSILPYHHHWQDFFSALQFVVVDELHTYRGVMGSHMAWVFRRLRRICRHYGADPVFVFCSATIKNPDELATQLTGLDVKTVLKSGAPAPPKHFLFLNGLEGAAQSAILLLHAALYREFRTIVYSQSRKMTELISLWASGKAGTYADRISAYRAGFLPEERREIEAGLVSGKLLAVISTSALELGIDIGKLDLCILVGYPGTIMSTWQRAGRVGRAGRESAVIMIGHQDALDQYFMHHPEEFFAMPPETAVINPCNPVIMAKHIECAAADLSLDTREAILGLPAVQNSIAALERTGRLLRSEDGTTLFPAARYPQRKVNLRGTGNSLPILHQESGAHIGQIDKYRAFHETHPGAVYLHRGETFLIEELDLEAHIITASPAKVNYFTRVKTNKTTEILEVLEQRRIWSTRVFYGRLKVTEQVIGYERRLVRGQTLVGTAALDLPPLAFETEGIWIEIPETVRKKTEKAYLHFMGGIHAVEHAAIGIMPLLVMTDRNDLGGISIPFHPQVQKAAVFIYDGVAGGIGLSRQAFRRAEEMLIKTLQVIRSCPCDNGCPACVHSPKCGSGNRPIAKDAAIYILERIQNDKPEPFKPMGHLPPVRPEPVAENVMDFAPPAPGPKRNPDPGPLHYGVLDLETQRSAQEVGGWGRADQMGISCVVVYDSGQDAYIEYLEKDISALIDHLKRLDLVVGFNIKRFDYKVISGYAHFNFERLPTLDILQKVHERLGYRLSLDHLGGVTLGAQKTANGLLALKWWKEGKIREIIDYCRQDVALTKDLYLFGRHHRYLLFKNKAGQVVRIPVEW